MKIAGIVLAALIVLIQYPLWIGKGGWLRVWDVDRQVTAQKAKNGELQRRNAGLAAEVNDLKTGTEAIEERARFELGMVRPDEVFYQYVDQAPPTTVAVRGK
ncbi:MAG: cell division protein FtsB [Betaproteobacteria bacterium]|nr:cell division protein FtsB [Betaproteobacteria bacterium]